jgi:RNA polymerase primary sigma factor
MVDSSIYSTSIGRTISYCTIPLNKVGSLNKINRAFSELEQQYEREPSAEELAGILEIPTEEVETTLGVAARHVSMDAPFVDGEDNF